MFNIFKKKPIVSNPIAEKLAGQTEIQNQIVEWQLKIAELRRKSELEIAQIGKLLGERDKLLVEINAARPEQRTALALRVGNIDKTIKGMNTDLSLIEEQIGNLQTKITQSGMVVTIDIGKSGEDPKNSYARLQDAIRTKKDGDANVEIENELVEELTEGVLRESSDTARILEEAAARGQSESASSTETVADSGVPAPSVVPAADECSLRSESAIQF